MLNHVVGLDDLMYIDHSAQKRLWVDSVHLVKDLLFLTFDLDTGTFAESCNLFCHCSIVNSHLGCVNYHHHVKESLDEGLRDIKNVDLVVSHICEELCDDTNCVLTDNCDDCSVHV